MDKAENIRQDWSQEDGIWVQNEVLKSNSENTGSSRNATPQVLDDFEEEIFLAMLVKLLDKNIGPPPDLSTACPSHTYTLLVEMNGSQDEKFLFIAKSIPNVLNTNVNCHQHRREQNHLGNLSTSFTTCPPRSRFFFPLPPSAGASLSEYKLWG